MSEPTQEPFITASNAFNYREASEQNARYIQSLKDSIAALTARVAELEALVERYKHGIPFEGERNDD